MADQTDLMDAAVDSAVAAFDVFVAGEAEDGSRLLTFDPRTPVSATVVWREGAPDALLTVTQAEPRAAITAMTTKMVNSAAMNNRLTGAGHSDRCLSARPPCRRGRNRCCRWPLDPTG